MAIGPPARTAVCHVCYGMDGRPVSRTISLDAFEYTIEHGNLQFCMEVSTCSLGPASESCPPIGGSEANSLWLISSELGRSHSLLSQHYSPTLSMLRHEPNPDVCRLIGSRDRVARRHNAIFSFVGGEDLDGDDEGSW